MMHTSPLVRVATFFAVFPSFSFNDVLVTFSLLWQFCNAVRNTQPFRRFSENKILTLHKETAFFISLLFLKFKINPCSYTENMPRWLLRNINRKGESWNFERTFLKRSRNVDPRELREQASPIKPTSAVGYEAIYMIIHVLTAELSTSPRCSHAPNISVLGPSILGQLSCMHCLHLITIPKLD